MDIKLLLITPVSGAVIGYFTNWLAIKMLFRPHEEKRIFGIKLPFTPGLLPKERSRLAKKIGETLSERLLTTEILTQKISSPEITDKILGLLNEAIIKLQMENREVGQLLNEFLKEESDAFLNRFEGFLNKNIRQAVDNAEFKESAARFLSEKISEIIKDFDHKEAFKQTAGILKPVILNKCLSSGVFSESSDLRQFIPEKLVMQLKVILRAKTPVLIDFFKESLTEDSIINEKLKNLTASVIDENIGTFIGIFINKEKVYSNIKEGIFNYLSDPESQADLILRIYEMIDNILDTPFSEFPNKLPEKNREDTILKISQFFGFEEEDSFYDKIWENIQTAVLNNEGFDLYEAILNVWPEFEPKTEEYILNKFNSLIENELDSLTHKVFMMIKNKLLNLRICDIMEKLDIDIFRVKAMELIHVIIEKGAVYLAEGMDIAKLAEEQINELDIREGEEIILSIVSRELGAITMVGGVLGFMIGLLTVVLNFV